MQKKVKGWKKMYQLSTNIQVFFRTRNISKEKKSIPNVKRVNSSRRLNNLK